ncbi:MAG: tetratricopeptide repeat-containing sensor histidine kinase [Chitinophagaceae bacterium]
MKKISLFIVLIILSKAYSQKNTQAYIDSILNALPNAKDDTARARMYKAISDECVVSMPNKALYYTQLGLNFVKKMPWQKGIAVFNLNLGRIYDEQGKPDSALYFYNISYETYKKNNLTQYVAGVLNNMGVVYQGKSNFTKAIQYFNKALEAAAQEGNATTIAKCWENIGLVYFEQQDYKKAIAFLNKATEIKIKNDLKQELAAGYNSLANCYYYLKDTTKAYTYYNKAIENAITYNDVQQLATGYTNLSVIEKNLKNNIELKLKAKALFDEHNPTHSIALNNLANLALEYFNIVKENKFDAIKGSKTIPTNKQQLLLQAKQMYNTVILLNQESNNKAGYAYTCGLLAELEAYMGNFKEAYKLAEQYHAINDSLYSQENKNKIATIEGQREVVVKEKEIELNKQKIKTQQKQTFGLIVGIILLSLIGFLFYKQSINRKKTNAMLKQLNNDLDVANKTKAKLFAIISHDLRSPIASLINFLHLQKNAPELLSEADKINYQNQLTQATEGLLQNMETILAWSKQQMENYTINKQWINLNEVFNYVKNSFTKENIVFENYIVEPIQTDVHLLQTIIHNTIANAIKASKFNTHPKVILKAIGNAQHFSISVVDNGKGLSQLQIEQLLHDDAIKSSNNGLGFFIVKDLAKAIQLNIKIESVLNTQTIVTFTNKP